MAITSQGVNNFGIRVKLFCIFSVVAIAVTCAAAWHYETSRLVEQERPYATNFTIGYLAHKAGMLGDSTFQNTVSVRQYLWIRQNFSGSADRLEQVARRTFIFPWPELGIVLGLGAFLAFSKLLELLKGKGDE